MPVTTIPVYPFPGKQKTYPSAANDISLAAPVGVWTNPASFTQIVAATSAAGFIAAVVAWVGLITNAQDFEIDIATGAAASEVVIATFRVGAQESASAGAMWYLIPTTAISYASGVRLSARARCSVASLSISIALVVAE